MSNRVKARIMAEQVDNHIDDSWSYWNVQGEVPHVPNTGGTSKDDLTPETTGAYYPTFHPEDFAGLEEEAKQAIINPDHYKMIPPGDYPNGIQYMGLIAFLLAKKDFDSYEGHIYSQVMKYLLRLGEKDSVRQDITKVTWYTNLFELYQDVKEGKVELQEFVAQWEIMERMEMVTKKENDR